MPINDGVMNTSPDQSTLAGSTIDASGNFTDVGGIYTASLKDSQPKGRQPSDQSGQCLRQHAHHDQRAQLQRDQHIGGSGKQPQLLRQRPNLGHNAIAANRPRTVGLIS